MIAIYPLADKLVECHSEALVWQNNLLQKEKGLTDPKHEVPARISKFVRVLWKNENNKPTIKAIYIKPTFLYEKCFICVIGISCKI